jgi:hypothetical protein
MPLWVGVIPAARRFLLGATVRPKARRLGETSTPTTSDCYAGMSEDYRWFRQDELVRKCVVTNAYFTFLAAAVLMSLMEALLWLLGVRTLKKRYPSLQGTGFPPRGNPKPTRRNRIPATRNKVFPLPGIGFQLPGIGCSSHRESGSSYWESDSSYTESSDSSMGDKRWP